MPIALLLAALIGTAQGEPVDQKATLVLVLILVVVIGGSAEELMFRGVGLAYVPPDGTHGSARGSLQLGGLGAVHLSNALATGTSAIFQAIAVTFTGYMLYLTRRWAGALAGDARALPPKTS